MNDSRFPAVLYFLMLVLGVLQWINAYPHLPEVMASHFNANGAPNGWQPKEVFFVFTAVVIAITAIPSFLVTRKISSLSPDKINLPNKSYWLAPEHSEETWRFIGAQMAWFGCGLLFVLLYAISQAINFNLPGVRHFNTRGMWYVLGGFVLFTTVWLVHFLRHFYNLPPSPASMSPGSLQR
ncbi:MAG: DUF1648 domain-containing protein [Candidatus Acidiferrum sp.]